MSRTMSLSSSATVINQIDSAILTNVSRNLSHWLTTKPEPYVNKLSGVVGIKTLNGIQHLCQLSPATMSKYLGYFARICVTDNFTTESKIDIMMIAMDRNGRYKVPTWYVFFMCCIFCLIIYLCIYIYFYIYVGELIY